MLLSVLWNYRKDHPTPPPPPKKKIYIYIYEPDTFRVYITAICCLQYKMENKMDPVGINPL